jgi:Ca-activated chloride channel homolog
MASRSWAWGLFLGLAVSGGCGSSVMGESAESPMNEVWSSEVLGEPGPDVAFEPPPPAIAAEPTAPSTPVEAAPSAAASAAPPEMVAYTEPGEIPRLQVAGEGGALLPLEHTHVEAVLSGPIAHVEVRQTYQNPHPEPIEAQYVFPLPENSAVDAMRIEIGDRVIEAKILERQQARDTYERAKSEGYTAALLEQERANVFTQSVANIEPGKKIDVVIHYLQDLTFDDGSYEFVFPMVVGPRFMPGEPLGGPPSGSGTKADTDVVLDASRISPPVLGRGERPGHDISLELVADTASDIVSYEVPTHEVVARKPADGTLRLTLAEKDSLPNRDFVLRYRTAEGEPKATLLTTSAAGDGSGFFSLVIVPPKLDVNELVGRREIVFVVDVSGSMSGVPMGMCQEAMRKAIRHLRPVDTFNVITFAGSTGKAFETPRPANDGNIKEALGFVNQMVAGGGTHMLDAVDEALTPRVEAGRHRYVFFLTDGLVGNEDQILSATSTFVAGLEEAGQRARVFGFGVGSSVNRALLDGLSRAGKGLTVYSTNREDPARAVNSFYRYIDRSVLRDVSVDWGSARASEVMPAETPDLFASHPLILHGRFQGTPEAITVTATSANGPVRIPVRIAPPAPEVPRDALGALWARSKIEWLERDLWGSPHQAEVVSQITQLGLDFHLVTRFTSFVAVDWSKKIGDGDPKKVVQPVLVPEDVDGTMAGLDMSPTGANIPMAQEAAEVDVGARGCFCRVGAPSSTSGSPIHWLLSAAALGLIGLRRARRRPSEANRPARTRG